MGKKQIKIGSVISYFTIFLNILLGLIYTPWILHRVGSSNYGLYTLATSLISLFLLDFGMSAAVARFISNFRAQNNFKGINSFIGLAIKFYVGICLLLSIILIGVYFNLESIYSNLTVDELQTFRLVFIITAFFLVICFPVNITNGILNAFEEYVWLKGADIINKLGTVVVTIIVLLIGGGIFSLVFINGFFNLITFIVKVLIIKYKTPVCISFKKNKAVSIGQIFSFSVWTTVNTVSQQMIFNLIPSVLAMVTDTLAITLYGFANVIEGYVYTITQAINGLFMPSVSRLVVNNKDAKSVLPLMIKVGRINQSIISILLIGLTVLGKDFVYLWVGEEFRDLYPCILLLSFPYFISAAQQIANTSVVVMNKVKYSALINLVTGLINLGSSYVIAQKWGVIGVCGVTSIVCFIRIICLNIIYNNVLKINIRIFFRECHLKMMPGILISLILGIVVTKIMPYSFSGLVGWIYLGIKALIVATVYFGVMWFIGWNAYEKKLILSMLCYFKKENDV